MLGCARDDESAATTRTAVRGQGGRCVVVRADLTTDEGIAEMFAAAVAFLLSDDASSVTGETLRAAGGR